MTESGRTDGALARLREKAKDVEQRAFVRASNSDRVRRVVYALRNRRIFANLEQHDRMLDDALRVDAYHAAINRHVKPGDVVVDVGTGSGVLSAFISRAGASRVHAIEHGPIADVAAAVFEDNRIDNVEIHRTHSRAFELEQRADVIVHEQIGSALFDERMVDSLSDLRDRVLKPGGLILPARARLFMDPVQMTDAGHVPFAWEQDLHGVSFRALRPFGDVQPHNYWYPIFGPFPLERYLTEEREPVVELDLHTAVPSDLPKRIAYRRRVTADGRLDGIVVYFDAGDAEQLWLSSAPHDPPTHWGAPLLRIESVPVRAGDVVDFVLEAGDLAEPRTWRWEISVVPASSSGEAA